MADHSNEERMANDKYVAVTFDPAATPQFTFSTKVVPMKSEGNIMECAHHCSTPW